MTSTSKQLREWLLHTGHEDQWWLNLDSVSEETPLTIAEIEERVRGGEHMQVKTLHVSLADKEDPQWVSFKISEQGIKKNCPFCAEEIQDEAIKCRHCGSDLSRPVVGKTGLPEAKDHDSYIAFTILSVLLPIVGVILGIVYLSKSDPLDKKLGEHALSFSILFMILWPVIFVVLGLLYSSF